MRRFGLGCLILALASAGCGESGPTEGTVPFQSGNTDQLGPLQSQMQNNVKNKTYLKKTEEPKAVKPSSPGANGKVETPKAETPK